MATVALDVAVQSLANPLADVAGRTLCVRLVHGGVTVAQGTAAVPLVARDVPVSRCRATLTLPATAPSVALQVVLAVDEDPDTPPLSTAGVEVPVDDVVFGAKIKGFRLGTYLGQLAVVARVAADDAPGFRGRLLDFLQAHSPGSVAHLESIIASPLATEPFVFTHLRNKYGLVDYRRRLREYYALYRLGSDATADAALQQWARQEEELVVHLVLAHGPEACDIPFDLRALTFCHAYSLDPALTLQRLTTVPDPAPADGFDDSSDVVLRQWFPTAEHRAAAMAQLTAAHGPEPDPAGYLYPQSAMAGSVGAELRMAGPAPDRSDVDSVESHAGHGEGAPVPPAVAATQTDAVSSREAAVSVRASTTTTAVQAVPRRPPKRDAQSAAAPMVRDQSTATSTVAVVVPVVLRTAAAVDAGPGPSQQLWQRLHAAMQHRGFGEAAVAYGGDAQLRAVVERHMEGTQAADLDAVVQHRRFLLLSGFRLAPAPLASHACRHVVAALRSASPQLTVGCALETRHEWHEGLFDAFVAHRSAEESDLPPVRRCVLVLSGEGAMAAAQHGVVCSSSQPAVVHDLDLVADGCLPLPRTDGPPVVAVVDVFPGRTHRTVADTPDPVALRAALSDPMAAPATHGGNAAEWATASGQLFDSVAVGAGSPREGLAVFTPAQCCLRCLLYTEAGRHIVQPRPDVAPVEVEPTAAPAPAQPPVLEALDSSARSPPLAAFTGPAGSPKGAQGSVPGSVSHLWAPSIGPALPATESPVMPTPDSEPAPRVATLASESPLSEADAAGAESVRVALQLGLRHLRHGNAPRAVQEWQAELRAASPVGPRSRSAVLELEGVVAELGGGSLRHAADCYRRALDECGGGGAAFRLGNLCEVRFGQLPEALQLFRTAAAAGDDAAARRAQALQRRLVA